MTLLLRSALFPPEFNVSIASFKSSSTQHDVYFVNDDPILSKIEDKARVLLLQSSKYGSFYSHRPWCQTLNVTCKCKQVY